MTNRDGWDPEHPEVARATGVPKEQGGWLHWAVGLGALALMLIAWLLRRG